MAIEELEYKGKKIAITDRNSKIELLIDNKVVVTHIPIGGEGYSTPLLPYKRFGSLVDLGKAVVRERCWSWISHEEVGQ